MVNTHTNLTAALSFEMHQPFSAICDQWLHSHSANLKDSTTVKYTYILEKHIKPHLGSYYINELHTERIRTFSNQLLCEEHLAVKTVRDILILLHKILADVRHTLDRQLIASNNEPLPPLVIVYPKQPPQELRVLTCTEQKRFVSYLNKDMDIYKFSVLLALSTGLRLGEVCALRWENISTTSGFIQVRYTAQRVKKLDPASENQTVLQIGSPKTLSSVRTIPLTKNVCKLCRRFQHADPEVFVLTGTTQIADPRKLQRKLKSYANDCGLENVHFHTLRHTFATRCVEVGCDIKTLSEILGHSNITMTMNRYVHPSLELKRKNLEKLERSGFCSTPAD